MNNRDIDTKPEQLKILSLPLNPEAKEGFKVSFSSDDYSSSISALMLYSDLLLTLGPRYDNLVRDINGQPITSSTGLTGFTSDHPWAAIIVLSVTMLLSVANLRSEYRKQKEARKKKLHELSSYQSIHQQLVAAEKEIPEPKAAQPKINLNKLNDYFKKAQEEEHKEILENDLEYKRLLESKPRSQIEATELDNKIENYKNRKFKYQNISITENTLDFEYNPLYEAPKESFYKKYIVKKMLIPIWEFLGISSTTYWIMWIAGAVVTGEYAGGGISGLSPVIAFGVPLLVGLVYPFIKIYNWIKNQWVKSKKEETQPTVKQKPEDVIPAAIEANRLLKRALYLMQYDAEKERLKKEIINKKYAVDAKDTKPSELPADASTYVYYPSITVDKQILYLAKKQKAKVGIAFVGNTVSLFVCAQFAAWFVTDLFGIVTGANLILGLGLFITTFAYGAYKAYQRYQVTKQEKQKIEQAELAKYKDIQCEIFIDRSIELQGRAPGQLFPGKTGGRYVLAKEGLYYIEDSASKEPITTHSLICSDEVKIKKLLKQLNIKSPKVVGTKELTPRDFTHISLTIGPRALPNTPERILDNLRETLREKQETLASELKKKIDAYNVCHPDTIKNAAEIIEASYYKFQEEASKKDKVKSKENTNKGAKFIAFVALAVIVIGLAVAVTLANPLITVGAIAAAGAIYAGYKTYQSYRKKRKATIAQYSVLERQDSEIMDLNLEKSDKGLKFITFLAGATTGIFIARALFIAGTAPLLPFAAIMVANPYAMLAILVLAGLVYGGYKLYEYYHAKREAKAQAALVEQQKQIDLKNEEVELLKLSIKSLENKKRWFEAEIEKREPKKEYMPQIDLGPTAEPALSHPAPESPIHSDKSRRSSTSSDEFRAGDLKNRSGASLFHPVHPSPDSSPKNERSITPPSPTTDTKKKPRDSELTPLIPAAKKNSSAK